MRLRIRKFGTEFGQLRHKFDNFDKNLTLSGETGCDPVVRSSKENPVVVAQILRVQKRGWGNPVRANLER